MRNHTPTKWRDMADITSFDLAPFRLEHVLGYPHAGNDVFHVKGLLNGEPAEAYLKVARHVDADVQRELAVLQALTSPVVPKVIAHHPTEQAWLLTKALPGRRLSVIVGSNENMRSLEYLPLQGATLAQLHQWPVDVSRTKHRKVFEILPPEHLRALGLGNALRLVQANKPATSAHCFVHGDYHYANLLWQNGRLSAILDFELCGLGNPYFDMAWAVFLRPEQRFLDTLEEVDAFLNGYQSIAPFHARDFWYWYIHIGLHFVLLANKADQRRMIRLIGEAMQRWQGIHEA